MADIARNFPNSRAEGGQRIILPELVIDSAGQLYQGGVVFSDPADSMLGKSAAPSGNPMWIARGVSAVEQLGDGVQKGTLGYGPHVFDNAASTNALSATVPLGWPVYSQFNMTASLTNGGGLYPPLGWFGGMTGEATPRPIVWVGYCPFAIREIMIPIVHGHADLTAAATTQAFTLYTTPGPCRMMHPPCVDTLTDFSGGGTASATLSVGAAADADALGTAKDIFTGADPGVMTAGVLGYPGALIAAGVAITVTYTADTTVAAYAAGALAGAIRLRPGS